MARNKLSLDFPGFTVLQKQLAILGGDAMKEAVDNALRASQDVVAKNVTQAMTPHHRSGRTERGIITNASNKPPVWTGTVAEIPVGFSITEGGLASIFLMYGTKLHGQPHIAPDRNLYNAVYGAATKREIQNIQRKEFEKVLEKVRNVEG